MALKVIGPGLPLIARAIAAMSRDTVLVGIPADSPPRRNPKDPPNAVIGYVMETGDPTRNIPARPFLGPGVAYAKADIAAALRKTAVQALKDVAALKTTAQNGGAVKDGLHEVGAITRDSVRKTIYQGNFVPLKPYTIAKRRERGNFDTDPLFDTAQMYAAVSYKVAPKK